MKKLIALVFFIAVSTATVFANEIRVTIDGERVTFADQQPVIIDGRTLIPIRGVFETLGFNVVWVQEIEMVRLYRDTDFMFIPVGQGWFYANGTTYELDVPAQLIGGRTMLPIRAIAESVGYNVNWNASTNTVEIF